MGDKWEEEEGESEESDDKQQRYLSVSALFIQMCAVPHPITWTSLSINVLVVCCISFFEPMM